LSASPTIHATAVLIGAKALLIRGEPGSGKSHLALRLIQGDALGFARLIGDDRVHLEVQAGRLLVRPAKELAGLLEVRGLGIRKVPHEALGVVGWVLDLVADADRLPAEGDLQTTISDVVLPRLALPAGTDPLPAVLAALERSGSGN
jgi:serine kinase of HPr protein (carbohydrate metabolism regulator)